MAGFKAGEQAANNSGDSIFEKTKNEEVGLTEIAKRLGNDI